jgi:diguanylate cyclase (GGDEF)-like protein
MHHLISVMEEEDAQKGPARVLLVDDDDATRTLMRDILSAEADFKLFEATDGTQALELLEEQEVDLVISDVRMPRMDGVSLLEAIRSKYGALPVIMVTGFGGDFGPRALELGADDCIYLPFRVEEFRFRVSRTLYFHHLLEVREQLIEQNRELWSRAITDPLTGLYNRNYFEEVFVSEFERARRYQFHLGCIIFDIDLFKKVNDEYGHLAGDHVLKRIGRLVQQTIRKVDIAARYGGEEFVLILPATHESGVELVGERMRELVEATDFRFTGADGQVDIPQITISLGASHYPDDAFQRADQMLKAADDSLLQAKREGRNRLEVAWDD